MGLYFVGIFGGTYLIQVGKCMGRCGPLVVQGVQGVYFPLEKNLVQVG